MKFVLNHLSFHSPGLGAGGPKHKEGPRAKVSLVYELHSWSEVLWREASSQITTFVGLLGKRDEL